MSAPAAAAAAALRAQEITINLSHQRPDGSNCFTVLDECGILYYSAGENIAAGQQTPQEVVTAWMNSPGHRDNILNPSFISLGVGIFYKEGGYGYHWVQEFIG